MKISDFDIIKRDFRDQRFGLVDLLSAPVSKVIYMVKKHHFSSKDELSNRVKDADARKVLHHDNILTFVNYQIEEDNMLINSLFEYPGDYKDWRGQYLDESVWFSLLHQSLKAITYLHKNYIVYGNISPKYLHFRNDEKVILLDRLDDSTSPILAQLKNLRSDDSLYMAPEVFDALNDIDINQSIPEDNLKIEYNPFKAESFALGISLLEIFSNSSNFQACYNKNSGRFDAERLESAIYDMKNQYIQNHKPNMIIDFIAEYMLSTNLEKRLTPKKLIKKLETDLQMHMKTIDDNEKIKFSSKNIPNWDDGSITENPLAKMNDSQGFDVLMPIEKNEEDAHYSVSDKNQASYKEKNDVQANSNLQLSKKIQSDENNNMSVDSQLSDDLGPDLKISSAKNMNEQDVEYEFNFDSHHKEISDSEKVIIKHDNTNNKGNYNEPIIALADDTDKEKEFTFIDGHDASTIRNSQSQSANISDERIENSELGTEQHNEGKAENLKAIEITDLTKNKGNNSEADVVINKNEIQNQELNENISDQNNNDNNVNKINAIAETENKQHQEVIKSNEDKNEDFLVDDQNEEDNYNNSNKILKINNQTNIEDDNENKIPQNSPEGANNNLINENINLKTSEKEIKNLSTSKANDQVNSPDVNDNAEQLHDKQNNNPKMDLNNQKSTDSNKEFNYAVNNDFDPYNDQQNNSDERKLTSEFLKNIDQQIRTSENYLNRHKMEEGYLNPMSVKNNSSELDNNQNQPMNPNSSFTEKTNGNDSFTGPLNYTQDTKELETPAIISDKQEISGAEKINNSLDANYEVTPIKKCNDMSVDHPSIDNKMNENQNDKNTQNNSENKYPQAKSFNNPIHYASSTTNFNPLRVDVRRKINNPYNNICSHGNYNTNNDINAQSRINFSSTGHETDNKQINKQERPELKEPTYVSYRELTIEKPHNSALNARSSKNGIGVDVKDLILVRIEDGVNIYRYKEDLNI